MLKRDDHELAHRRAAARRRRQLPCASSASATSSLPQYRDWGFAVFQLAAENSGHVHPMSFLFYTREPRRVFFPTVHVHDGTVAERARFDHMLYAQTERPPLSWSESGGPARDFVDIGRAQRLVRSTSSVHRLAIEGTQTNEDTWLDA